MDSTFLSGYPIQVTHNIEWSTKILNSVPNKENTTESGGVAENQHCEINNYYRNQKRKNCNQGGKQVARKTKFEGCKYDLRAIYTIDQTWEK